MAFKNQILSAGIIIITDAKGEVDRKLFVSTVPNGQITINAHQDEQVVSKVYSLRHPVHEKMEAAGMLMDMNLPHFDTKDKTFLKQILAGNIPLQTPRGEGRSREHIPAFRDRPRAPQITIGQKELNAAMKEAEAAYRAAQAALEKVNAAKAKYPQAAAVMTPPSAADRAAERALGKVNTPRKQRRRAA